MTTQRETSQRIAQFISLGTSSMPENKDQRIPTSRIQAKYVPVYAQNVLALEPLPGMEYALDWLKYEKLHKYWPMISRFSYHQLINLNHDNWEATLSSVGVHSPHAVTHGAKTRFLSLTRQLRSRASRLNEAIRSGSLKVMLSELKLALRTPLADAPEINGEKLIPLIRQALEVVSTKVRHNPIDIRKSAARVQEIFDHHPSVATCYSK